MAGLYIHIPFCTKKCHYCNFFSLPAIEYIDEYIGALCKEINLRQNYLSEPYSTIYLGGGTPSLLKKNHLQQIFSTIQTHLQTLEPEISMELNPDDITPEYLQMIRDMGVTRVSIGIQSFRDEDLIWLNRRHNGAQAISAIEQSRSAGFNNISLDLIYAIPGQDVKAWKQQVQKALELRPEHISAYSLTVEPGTALDHYIKKGTKENVSDSLAAECFAYLRKTLISSGYEHYEISNFSLPGYRSRHNTSYWNGTPYMGIGPSAHSFDGNSRQWNVSALREYITKINTNEIPCQIEILTTTEKIDEYVMTSLRTTEGCNLQFITDKFGKEYSNIIINNATSDLETGHLCIADNTLYVTEKGLFLMDGITANLFL